MPEPTDPLGDVERDIARRQARDALQMASERVNTGDPLPDIVLAQAAHALGLSDEFLRHKNILVIERSSSAHADVADALQGLIKSSDQMAASLDKHTSALETERASREKLVEKFESWAPKIGGGLITMLGMLGTASAFILRWLSSEAGD